MSRFSSHKTEFVQSIVWERYGEYLCSIGREPYEDKALKYIDKEDSSPAGNMSVEFAEENGLSTCRIVELLYKIRVLPFSTR